MSIRCPACGRRVPRKQIDVTTDRVTCRHCGKVASYRAISGVNAAPASGRGVNMFGPPATPASNARPATSQPAPRPILRAGAVPVGDIDPANPPRGAWFRDDGITMTVGAHTRSIGGGIFMMFISLFWLSVNAMFIFGSLITIFNSLGFSTGKLGFGSLAGGLFMLFVSLLFGLGGWFIVTLACMLLAGKVEFTLRGDELRTFSGVAMVGKRRALSVATIASITDDARVVRTSRSSTTVREILIKHPPAKDVRLGQMVNDPRRRFVVRVLKQVVGR